MEGIVALAQSAGVEQIRQVFEQAALQARTPFARKMFLQQGEITIAMVNCWAEMKDSGKTEETDRLNNLAKIISRAVVTAIGTDWPGPMLPVGLEVFKALLIDQLDGDGLAVRERLKEAGIEPSPMTPELRDALACRTTSTTPPAPS
jgi:hypothetical protein